MPPTLQELGIDRLSSEDKIALAQAIWDSVAEAGDAPPLTEELKGVLTSRMADLDANSGIALTWDEIKRRVRGER